MRSPVSVLLASAAAIGNASPWMPLDYLQRPFDVQLNVSPDGGATGTVALQYTPDNPNDFNTEWKRTGLALTRAGTVATIQLVNPPSVGAADSVVVIGSGDPNLDGTFPVAGATANTVTYAVANTGLLIARDPKVAFLRVFTPTILQAVTARADGGLTTPYRAVRIITTVAGAGQWRLTATQGYGRG